MKRKTLLVLWLTFSVLMSVSALSLDGFRYAYGDWDLEGGRLVQSDIKAGMARVDIPMIQRGKVTYDFNVRYEDGGAEDQHAGFGIHLFVDNPPEGKAWGNGDSYLLWLNYDANAKGITPGLSAQVYKSISNSQMRLVADFDLNRFAHYLTASNASFVVPVKMVVDGTTGDVKLYDPMDDGYVYKFNLGNSVPMNGTFISLRTNSASFSFGL